MPRLTCHYSGRVQGVGFRWRVQAIVNPTNLTGTVRNLADGRVELILEGDADAIDSTLSRIRTALTPYIQGFVRTTSPATGEFPGFTIQR